MNQKYENFSLQQWRQVEQGELEKLTNEQIEFYAKPEYDALQMEQIRLAIQDGLSEEQLNIGANPKFSWRQMAEIYSGFRKGLSVGEVKKYAKPELDPLSMFQVKVKILHKCGKLN